MVVLQLVGEGLLALDEPVATYLPGLLRGDGIDGRSAVIAATRVPLDTDEAVAVEEALDTVLCS